MPVMTAIALLLASAPATGARTLKVSIAQSVGLLKGATWPTSPKTGERKSMYSLDGPTLLTVTFPSGKTWRSEGLHSLSLNLSETGETLKDVYVEFERPPGDWPDTVARAIQLAKELGASTDQLERQRSELLARPGKGSNRFFPSFFLEGCISVTTTITPKGASDPKVTVRSWTVSVELGVNTPQLWRNHETWPGAALSGTRSAPSPGSDRWWCSRSW